MLNFIVSRLNKVYLKMFLQEQFAWVSDFRADFMSWGNILTGSEIK